MTDEPEDRAATGESDLEKLSGEVARLRHQIELDHRWQEEREKRLRDFDQHKKDVVTEINKRLGALSVVGLLVAGLGWWSVTLPVRSSVKDRLNREFASQNIRTLISDAALRAAQSQTARMMNTTLKPAVAQALQQIHDQRNAVTQFTAQFRQDSKRNMDRIQNEVAQQRQQDEESLKALREEYTQEINQLQTLVDFQEKLEQIQIFKYKAINGDFNAYESLSSYKSSNPNLASAVVGAVLEVKEPYLAGNRTAGTSIWETNLDGSKGPTDAQIPSGHLISFFLLNGQRTWQARAKAAQLLGSKREEGVPDALLSAMQSDPNLWVRRAALVSFRNLTGYQPKDAFDFDGAVKWWGKHESDYLKTIPK